MLILLKRRKSAFLKFRKSQNAASMVEFTIVAMPFLILIFGIIEVGLLLWADLELEAMRERAARAVFTGQATERGALKTVACTGTALLSIDCTTKLRIDVRRLDNFGNIAGVSETIDPYNAAGEMKPDGDFTFTTPAGVQIILISLFYEWPVMNIIPAGSLGVSQNGSVYLRNSAALRTEPY